MGVYRIYPKQKRNPFGFLGGFSVTVQLIILNLVLYIISLFILSKYGDKFFLDNVAITPSLILSGKAIWTFLTSMVSHVWFVHIFANMFTLFFIGSFLEKLIGGKRFFWVYLISGIVGGVFFVLGGLMFNKDLPGIGASGAIFGILGVLAVLVPYSKIYLIVGPLIAIIAQFLFGHFFAGSSAIPIINIAVMIYFFVAIFSLFSFDPNRRKIAIPLELPMWLLPIIAIVPLVIIGFFVQLPIGNSAHLGGLVVGLIYGFYLRQKFPRKVQWISNHFS